MRSICFWVECNHLERANVGSRNLSPLNRIGSPPADPNYGGACSPPPLQARLFYALFQFGISRAVWIQKEAQRVAAGTVLDQTRGYPHILGAADAILYGAPPENLRAVVEAWSDYDTA